jgi:hypothetical protein
MSQQDCQEIGAEEHTMKPDGDEEVTKERSVRTRTLTEKGKDFHLQKLQKSFSSSKSRISRQCQLVSQALDSGFANVVGQELSNLDKCFAEAEQTHLELMELLPEDHQLEQQAAREFLDSQVFEMKHIAYVWLKDNESRSGRSEVSSRSHKSVGSHHSKSSGKSSKISKTSKVESLKKEQAMLQKVQSAKKEEMECQMRRETAELQLKVLRAQAQQDEQFIDTKSLSYQQMITSHNLVTPELAKCQSRSVQLSNYGTYSHQIALLIQMLFQAQI